MNMKKLAVGFFVVVLVFAATIGVIDAQTDFVNEWLRRNLAGSSDGISLKAEFTPPDTLAKDFATTDSIETIQYLTRTSTGTPAIGIGGSLDLGVETTVGNVEKGIRLAATVVDETAATEDFSFDVMEMIAGTAPAKTFSISNGIATMKGGATLDNTTSADELAIAETNIQLSGIIDLEGGDVTVNDDSGDYDFTVESDGDDAAFMVDGGIDTAIFGAWEASTIATDTSTSYSISSASKASYHIQTASAAATAHLMTDLLTAPGPGGKIVLKTGNANDIVVDTEGAATIEGAATYTIDGTLEAVEFRTDGTNWHVFGSYLE